MWDSASHGMTVVKRASGMIVYCFNGCTLAKIRVIIVMFPCILRYGEAISLFEGPNLEETAFLTALFAGIYSVIYPLLFLPAFTVCVYGTAALTHSTAVV
jgi:hypothetical protein